MGGKIKFYRHCNSFLDGPQCRAFSTPWHAKQLLPRKARPHLQTPPRTSTPPNEPIAAARQNQAVADSYVLAGRRVGNRISRLISFQTEERTRP